jgi:hypothetical protein
MSIASAKALTAVNAWVAIGFMITPGSNVVGADSRGRALSLSLSPCPVRVDSPFGVFTTGSRGDTVECGGGSADGCPARATRIRRTRVDANDR